MRFVLLAGGPLLDGLIELHESLDELGHGGIDLVLAAFLLSYCPLTFRMLYGS